MHFGDYTFIFLLALVLFGPKKLPEIGRQLGKLLAEFRRASNEFKYQIQEELRNMEEEERRKKRVEEQAALTATSATADSASPATPTILPPSTGTQVSTSKPYAAAAEVTEATALEAETVPEGEIAVHPTAPAETPEPPVSLDVAVESNGVHIPATEMPAEVAHHD